MAINQLVPSVFVLLLMAPFSNTFAVDFDDCQDRMEKVKKAARDADVTVENPDDAQNAMSILDDIGECQASCRL